MQREVKVAVVIENSVNIPSSVNSLVKDRRAKVLDTVEFLKTHEEGFNYIVLVLISGDTSLIRTAKEKYGGSIVFAIVKSPKLFNGAREAGANYIMDFDEKREIISYIQTREDGINHYRRKTY